MPLSLVRKVVFTQLRHTVPVSVVMPALTKESLSQRSCSDPAIAGQTCWRKRCNNGNWNACMAFVSKNPSRRKILPMQLCAAVIANSLIIIKNLGASKGIQKRLLLAFAFFCCLF